MSLSKKPPCKHCGHKEYRHIRKQGPNNAVCMNMLCPCANYEARDYQAEIREAGEQGLAAGQNVTTKDVQCTNCTHSLGHHDMLGEPGYIFRRPCGENDCQCDEFEGDNDLVEYLRGLGISVNAALQENLDNMVMTDDAEELLTVKEPTKAPLPDRVEIDGVSYSIAGLKERLYDAQQTVALFENPILQKVLGAKLAEFNLPPISQEMIADSISPDGPLLFNFRRASDYDPPLGTDIPHMHMYGPSETRQVQFCTYDNCGHPRVRDAEGGSEDLSPEEAARRYLVHANQVVHEMELADPIEKIGDAVNHPSHYNQHGPEVIELVRWLSFNRGNAVKYIARAGIKDPAKEEEDLEKAIWYLEDELKIVRGEVS